MFFGARTSGWRFGVYSCCGVSFMTPNDFTPERFRDLLKAIERDTAAVIALEQRVKEARKE